MFVDVPASATMPLAHAQGTGDGMAVRMVRGKPVAGAPEEVGGCGGNVSLAA